MAAPKRTLAYMVGVLRSLLPLIERSGVANVAEIGIDTLAARLRDGAVAAYVGNRSPSASTATEAPRPTGLSHPERGCAPRVPPGGCRARRPRRSRSGGPDG